MFISSCSASTSGRPRNTKHHGQVSQPQVAVDYLDYAAGIDIHNHVRTGSTGFEDAWLTKAPHHRQFAGTMGFVFTNAYLAQKYFHDKKLVHSSFKVELANSMKTFIDKKGVTLRRLINIPSVPEVATLTHVLLSIGNKKQMPCYYCRHGHADKSKRNKTSFYCSLCGIDKPICTPHMHDCWTQHLHNGMPAKRRFAKV